jgi:hypothetical protein
MDFEQPSCIGGALIAPGNHLPDLRLLLFGEFRAAASDPSILSGSIQAGPGAFSQHGALEF